MSCFEWSNGGRITYDCRSQSSPRLQNHLLHWGQLQSEQNCMLPGCVMLPQTCSSPPGIQLHSILSRLTFGRGQCGCCGCHGHGPYDLSLRARPCCVLTPALGLLLLARPSLHAGLDLYAGHGKRRRCTCQWQHHTSGCSASGTFRRSGCSWHPIVFVCVLASPYR